MPPYGIRIRIVETGQEFQSIRDCARAIDGDFSAIAEILRGSNHRKTHKGYTFEHAGDEND